MSKLIDKVRRYGTVDQFTGVPLLPTPSDISINNVSSLSTSILIDFGRDKDREAVAAVGTKRENYSVSFNGSGSRPWNLFLFSVRAW